MAPEPMRTRITELLGVEYPIVQAPMGYIARAQLASAVSNAGGLGIIETSSGQLDQVRDEIAKMRDLTDKPFGVNIAQLFVRDARSSTSSTSTVSGSSPRRRATRPCSPARCTTPGSPCSTSCRPSTAAQKAIDAGVDGLVVEGRRGGRVQGEPRRRDDGPPPTRVRDLRRAVIAAGGICDGASMAAAFALGAEGVQMGTRMVSAAESPVHDNYKQLIVDSAETSTVFLNRWHKPGFRVLATPKSEAQERLDEQVVLGSLDGILRLYFDGDLDAAFAFGGQVAGRIDGVRPVAEILHETVDEFRAVLAGLQRHVDR